MSEAEAARGRAEGRRAHRGQIPANALSGSPTVVLGWRDTILVVLIAALPPVVAWAAFGTIQTPDTSGYLAYAAQIKNGAIPSGQALLHEGAIPISLFRAPGYPALLAGLQAILPSGWRQASIVLQIVLSAGVAGAVYGTALRLGARRGLAIAAALLPAVGFIVVLQISLLTDALYAVFFIGAALSLVVSNGLFGGLVAGLFLALATSFREATPFLAVFFLPLAVCSSRRRWFRLLATILPPLCVVAALMAWNSTRIGQPIVTTTAEVNMVQPLFPLISQGLPVYEGDDAFDRTARETLTQPGWDQMLDMLERLFQREGMTAPDLAAAATARYWRAWKQFPGAMLLSSVRRFRISFLRMPFAPVDTIADLNIYSGRQPSPDLVKLNVLWRRTLAGDVKSLGWLLLVVVTRSIGMIVACVGIVGPWLRGRLWRLRALWLVCAAVPAVYMPVHFDARFLLPVVPLLCIAAAVSVSPSEGHRHGRRFMARAVERHGGAFSK